jgi:uncharacterized protein YacL
MMILILLRALFILLITAVGFVFVYQDKGPIDRTDMDVWVMPAVALSFGVLLVCIDILAPARRKLAIFAGTFFGLVVGLAIAYLLSFAVRLLVEQYATGDKERTIQFINMMISVASCYLAISFILQTKDDFRFIVPYVEFSKQTKGARPIVVDTSVLIDGRITDIVNSGIIESQLVVPQFVLVELQQIADSADKLKRNRGRRGLDVLAKLRNNTKAEVTIFDPHRDEPTMPVDQRLMSLAEDLGGRVLTNDFNLNKVAQLRGVSVVNVNDLANALKPAVLPGERMSVRVIKRGEDPGQGVGYLDDGTMVVVEQGAGSIGQDVEFVVTNTVQRSAGKMIFGRLSDVSAVPVATVAAPAAATAPPAPPAARRAQPPSPSSA